MSFLQSPQQSTSAAYCWLFSIDRRRLGVHIHDGWCAELGGQVELMDEEYKCMHLLPVLEITPATFANQLQLAERANPAYAASIRTFPKRLLLKHVFHTSVSGYWPALALDWLADDVALQFEFKPELLALTQNKAMPQALRQRAQKMLRGVSVEDPQPVIP